MHSVRGLGSRDIDNRSLIARVGPFTVNAYRKDHISLSRAGGALWGWGALQFLATGLKYSPGGLWCFILDSMG